MNRCIFMGRIGADVESRYSQAGTAMAKFSIAVDNGYGENKKTSWFRMTAFGKTGENIAKFFSRGKRILVECRAEESRWQTKEGESRRAIEFIVDNFHFVERVEPGWSNGGAESPQVDESINDEVPF